MGELPPNCSLIIGIHQSTILDPSFVSVHTLSVLSYQMHLYQVLVSERVPINSISFPLSCSK